MNTFRYANSSKGQLQNNPAFNLPKSHALSVFNANAVYSFIPKNACSTLRYSLAIANGCLEPGDDVNWIHANNGTFSVSLREAAIADYSFTVLRCPLRRLVSTFWDKIVGRGGNTGWTYYNLIEREVSLDDLTFEYFARSLVERGILKNEIHWRPQVDFLLYKEYSDVFSVERFSDAVKTLKEKINFEVYDTRQLIKHGSDQYEKVGCGLWHNVPVKELYGMRVAGQMPSSDVMYNRSLYDIVRNAYAADIELYKSWCRSEDLLIL